MLPPLMGAGDLPPPASRFVRICCIVGVLLVVTLVGAAVFLDRGSGQAGTGRPGEAALRPGRALGQGGPGVDLTDLDQLPAGRAVPVLIGRVTVADLRCRAWPRTTTAGTTTDARLFPVARRSDGRSHCLVSFSAAVAMRPGAQFTVQLVRVDDRDTIVEEYHPVILQWSDPGPDGD